MSLIHRLKAGGGAGWLADRARWLVLIAAALEGGRAASLLGMTGAGCALLAGKYSRTCDAAAGPRRVHLGGVMWMHCVRLPRFPAAASLPARTGGFGNNGCTTSSRWQRLLEGNIKAKAYVSLSMMKLIWLLPLEVAREIQKGCVGMHAAHTFRVTWGGAAVAAVVEPKWYPPDSQAMRFCRRSASSAASALPVASSGSG
ncbi:uncharacterized protein PAN0_014d4899 [Moesziomyces antarcticus]|uniref:Uncharacterized protein n=1 Tax=Pseudozyma antarctica TaxID=84753 RepID=A0A081CJ30_PSEA2|nr:uncharacterized protein PAN0_014d4899 [Moesziomyces antarcticus]GAK66676.1 hypothetical protein PAN0_014d4899 [Moesziomyces antarcticus]